MKWFALIILCLPMLVTTCIPERQNKVLGFYTARNDQAHISFVHEANRWLEKKSKELEFSYDSTNDWTKLNDQYLRNYKLIIFLDTRPDSVNQREAFEKYMQNGGAWLGFHFAAFALNNSDFPQDWDWYHNEFLGAGEYKGNSWRPTPAYLKVEREHQVTKGLPQVFKSSANEWYSWQNELRNDPDIEILLSIDTSSFPLGTGPKAHEIWHEGDYPVVWTNKNYRMVYINMGHNDIDYEHNSNKELSLTFGNKFQDELIINALEWLVK